MKMWWMRHLGSWVHIFILLRDPVHDQQSAICSELQSEIRAVVVTIQPQYDIAKPQYDCASHLASCLTRTSKMSALLIVVIQKCQWVSVCGTEQVFFTTNSICESYLWARFPPEWYVEAQLLTSHLDQPENLPNRLIWSTVKSNISTVSLIASLFIRWRFDICMNWCT